MDKKNGLGTSNAAANSGGQRSKKRRTILAIVLVSMAGLLLAGAGFIYRVTVVPENLFTPAPQITPAPPRITPPLMTPDAPEPEPEPEISPEEALMGAADLSFMQNKVNILMLGWDQSPEREDEESALYRDEKNNYRSDALLLLTVDFEKRTADLISIPRDTYAPIYNTKGRWKINAAFAHGGCVEGEGFVYAMNTVGNLLGVPINYYVGVDMIGLKAVVDAMDGVDYDVDVEIKLNGRVLKKGFQHLDGQQVLDYCRARKGISTDVGRADRQQRMLFAIFEQLKSRNQLVNIPRIYASVADKIETNLGTEQIAALAVFALNLDMDDLNRHTLKGEYITNVGSSNASFYVLYNSRLKALVKEVFGIDIKTNSRYDVSYVKREKAEQEARAAIDAAEYLLSSFPGAAGAGAVKDGMEFVRGLSATDVFSDMESGFDMEVDLEILGDDTAINGACAALNAAMVSLCRLNGISQAELDPKKLPAAIYKELPATRTVSPASGVSLYGLWDIDANDMEKSTRIDAAEGAQEEKPA